MDFTLPRLHQLSSVWQIKRHGWWNKPAHAEKKRKEKKIVLLASVSPQGSEQVPVKSI